jgi:hypothetical protein
VDPNDHPMAQWPSLSIAITVQHLFSDILILFLGTLYEETRSSLRLRRSLS